MKQQILTAIIFAAATACYAGEDASVAQSEPERLTSVIYRCLESSVNTLAHPKPGQINYGVGAGSILHESGLIITNNHVAAGGGIRTVVLPAGESFQYRVLLAAPEPDLAIIKIDANRELKPMKIGRSNDLMEGETAFIIGNPAGVMNTVTTGIVSGLRGDRKNPGQIQFDAPSNHGNSGGPLCNILGEQIGIVHSKMNSGIGFAIPIDVARNTVANYVNDISRCGFSLGAVIDPMGEPRVILVKPDSPAQAAGLKDGDIITRANGLRVSDSMHFYLAMLQCVAGQELDIHVVRNGKKTQLKPVLAGLPPRDAVQAPNAVPGIKVTFYYGNMNSCEQIKHSEQGLSGRVNLITHTVIQKPENKHYGLVFSGYFKAPVAGAYRFYLSSDDGSRMFIGDELLIDNDGVHATQEKSALVALQPGLHPITIEYFQGEGGAHLTLFYEGPGISKQEVMPESYFSEP